MNKPDEGARVLNRAPVAGCVDKCLELKVFPRTSPEDFKETRGYIAR